MDRNVSTRRSLGLSETGSKRHRVRGGGSVCGKTGFLAAPRRSEALLRGRENRRPGVLPAGISQRGAKAAKNPVSPHIAPPFRTDPGGPGIGKQPAGRPPASAPKTALETQNQSLGSDPAASKGFQRPSAWHLRPLRRRLPRARIAATTRARESSFAAVNFVTLRRLAEREAGGRCAAESFLPRNPQRQSRSVSCGLPLRDETRGRPPFRASLLTIFLTVEVLNELCGARSTRWATSRTLHPAA